MTTEQIEKEIAGLIRDHKGKLVNHLRNRGFPEDVIQHAIDDALLAVFDKRERGHRLDHPAGFLFTAAQNAATDLCRRERRHAAQKPDSDAVAAVPAPDMLERAEAQLDLREAIEQLPLQQRRVFLLRCQFGYSVSETARVLGIAEGTVGATTTAAKRNLRRILGMQGGRREEETL